MSLHQLTTQNFHLVGRQRKTLNINLQGNVLVFFKMQGCVGCNAFEPVFYQLAGIEKRINYGMVDLTPNRNVINMSRQTNTPIQAVPSLIFYINGRPHAKYNGKKNIQALRGFIAKALQSAPPPVVHQGGGADRGSHQSDAFMPRQGYQPQQYPGSQPKVHMPEGLKSPSMQGIVKGGGRSNYAYLNPVDEEDEEKLEMPEHVTPHNMPWESGYKKIGTLD